MPFAKEKWNDCKKWTIEWEEKNGEREWVGKKVVTGEMVDGCLDGLVRAPLPEWKDDEEARGKYGESHKDETKN
jgi:hypothetical protein